jgi:hypothetical protein
MRTIRPCPSCAAPVTIKMARCSNCNRVNLRGYLARTVSSVATLVGGVTLSSTLAACYGAPCAQPDDPTCREWEPVASCATLSSQPQVDDKDGDGYCLANDCNENDKTINASKLEIPNDGIDQNCDGKDTR